jgi:protein-disulfide isomerase
MEEEKTTDINEENSTESTEPMEPVKPAEPVEPVGPTEPTEPAQPVKPINPIEPVNKLQSVSEPVKKFLNKPCKMIAPVAIVVVGVLISLGAMYLNPSIFAINNDTNGAEKPLTIEDAGAIAIEFINENMLQGEMAASIIESAEESGIYRIKLKIAEEEFDSYITKDGRFLFPQFIDIEEIEKEKEVVKADRPDVKVFVMSYCPYGLQAQKMFLPVYELLKDEADINIYYVDYIMHDKPEIDENLRQYCIDLEQKDKYYDYLNCFVYGATGDAAKCITSAGIDATNLNACIARVDQEFNITEQYNDKSTWQNGQFPQFGLHTDLNQQYEVQGSPSIIINGKTTEIATRSPENFKSIVCESFNIAPEKCSQTLSDEVPAPGFGYGIGGSSDGECK